MNPYTLLGSALGTTAAVSLAQRLAAWHDAMVTHERRLRAGLLATSDATRTAHTARLTLVGKRR